MIEHHDHVQNDKQYTKTKASGETQFGVKSRLWKGIQL